MTTISVTASKSYDVIVACGLINQVAAYVSQIKPSAKIAIISDNKVWSLYGDVVLCSLQDAGYPVCQFIFPGGEESKNGNTYLSIVNFLAENQITRSDLLIALGGGVVGDITGFAAATYLRGISYIQIPTTLLAMVDSSIGGKTAIDLTAGKNLVGAFYQPSLVLCDIDTLTSLPKDILCDGCAEVIKYGILYDRTLFDHLLAFGLSFDRESVISRCIELKRDVVSKDEFDNSERQKLNLGHTIGHGVEAQSNYTISHGKAVAIGMSIVTRSAIKHNFCSKEVASDVLNILRKFELPHSTNFTAKELYASALSDKKRMGNVVNLIIPKTLGKCIISPTSINELESFIEAGL